MRPLRLAFLLALVFAAAAATATTAHAAEAFLGKWKLVGIITKDGPAPKEALEAAGMIWSFKPGGVAFLKLWRGEDTTELRTTWTSKGDQLTTIEENKPNTVTWAVKGKKLTMSKAGVTLEFQRQKK